ncbi:MAG: hypothetical protein FGM50_09335, partial [Mycobacterium sp.]|nr:hypothetical protein [Mycobacterium sp.]
MSASSVRAAMARIDVQEKASSVSAPVGVAGAVSSVGSAVGGWQPGAILRIFLGNGTAANPNAGILVGNGYTYTGYAGACTSGSCPGGNGGLIGNGGNGYNGGNGGAAGWFGTGGNGGAALT